MDELVDYHLLRHPPAVNFSDPFNVQAHEIEFVVATASGADHDFYLPIVALLRRINHGLQLDPVFVGQHQHGQPFCRKGDSTPSVAAWSGCDPIEVDFSKLLLINKGATSTDVIGTSVIGPGDVAYGTLACTRRRDGSTDDEQLQTLRSVARLVGAHLGKLQRAIQ